MKKDKYQIQHTYVADCRQDTLDRIGRMWKVGKSREITKWLLPGEISPYSLSIREGRVLVTPLGTNQLFIYGPQEQLETEIQLPQRTEPRHAVETAHKTVVVCHTASLGEILLLLLLLPLLLPPPPPHAMETSHKTVVVCHWGRRDRANVFQLDEFDFAGVVLKKFHSVDTLHDFPHMCLDRSGRLMLVDSWSSRVILLNKDLQLERILVCHHEGLVNKYLRWNAFWSTTMESSSTRTCSWNAFWSSTWPTRRTDCATWNKAGSCTSGSRRTTSRCTASRRISPIPTTSDVSAVRMRQRHAVRQAGRTDRHGKFPACSPAADGKGRARWGNVVMNRRR